MKTSRITGLLGILLVLGSLMLIPGCYYDNEEDLYPTPVGGNNCDTTAITYAIDIQPQLDAHCYSCHGAGSPMGSVNLEDYSGVHAVAMSGQLYCALSWGTGCHPMPDQGQKLPDCTINKFKAWIDEGAQNN
jgi:hypothetical protein